MYPLSHGFATRWQATVVMLRRRAERVQVTADDLPMSVTLVGPHASPGVVGLSQRHVAALNDYMIARNRIRAPLAEYGVEQQ